MVRVKRYGGSRASSARRDKVPQASGGASLAARPKHDQSAPVISPMTFGIRPALVIALSSWLSACSSQPSSANADGDDASAPASDALSENGNVDVTQEPDLAACVADGPIGTPRDDCPLDLPDGGDCPTASPSYIDVAPIFAARCSICHQPGGLDSTFRFDSYAAIYNNRQTKLDIFTQIYNCRMPPQCAPNLSPDERKVMLEWFVCGAPNTLDAGTP
jgi:hypothetical protein